MDLSHVGAVCLACTSALAAVLAGCAAYNRPPLPIIQQARPFQALNENMVGSAPPVAAGVTDARLVAARSEPQNWMTYYGAYDGERYSPLNQINARNVSKLRPA